MRDISIESQEQPPVGEADIDKANEASNVLHSTTRNATTNIGTHEGSRVDSVFLRK